jgi:RHS repeat-associated protein
MEAGSNNNFQNYTNTTNWDLMDHTEFGGSTYSQKLTGASGQQVGVAKSYKVYPGDKIRIKAYAKYQGSSGTSNLSGFAGALLSAFGLPTPGGEEVGTPSAVVNAWGSLIAAGEGHEATSEPKAFVNILVFDKNYNFLDMAWDQIDGGEQIGVSPKADFDSLSQEYTAREEGFIYVYVSNENPTLVDVYFDDVTVTHTKSNLIQGNEYYPFGMQTANCWTRENVTGNSFLGNGGTEFNATSNLYDLAFRNYDPVLGRLVQLDPMMLKYESNSPYNFAFNNPAFWTDASGADPDFLDFLRSLVQSVSSGGAKTYTGQEVKQMYAGIGEGGGTGIDWSSYGTNMTFAYASGGSLFYVVDNTFGHESDNNRDIVFWGANDLIEVSGREEGDDGFFSSLPGGDNFGNTYMGQDLSNLGRVVVNLAQRTNAGVGLLSNIIGSGFDAGAAKAAEMSRYTARAVNIAKWGGRALGGAGVAISAGSVVHKFVTGQDITTNDKIDFGVSAGLFVTGLLVVNPVGLIVVAGAGLGYGLYTIWRDGNY